MILKSLQSAAEFLQETQAALQANETVNNLMYGLALRLQSYPARIQIPPYFCVVRQGSELQAAALMTPPHNLVVFAAEGGDAAGAFALIARALHAGGWPVPGVLGPNEPALAFACAWQALTGETYRLKIHERVYELRQVVPPPAPPGRMRPAEPGDLELVARWIYDFTREAVPDEAAILAEVREDSRVKISEQDLYLWDDHQPVALAGKTRPTPNGVCIGPVYTPAEFRRTGYATALTAALSQLQLDGGKKYTALFTNLANPISNNIYQKIGYCPVCDFDLYGFIK